MPKPETNPRTRIENYINSASGFARPICRKLRETILKTEPTIVEDWKWGPNYSKHGMVCGFGAFQKHVTLNFFQGASMRDPRRLFVKEDAPAKTSRHMKFTSVNDIDGRVVAAYLKEAIELNSNGVRRAEVALAVPPDMKKMLANNHKIRSFFESLAYTHRKEYIRWIESAKKEETRSARIKKTAAMLAGRIKHP